VSFGKIQTLQQYTEEHLADGGAGEEATHETLGKARGHAAEAAANEGQWADEANIAGLTEQGGCRSLEAVAEHRRLLPRGSEARRRLVAGLGAYVSEQQRAANVLPQTVLLAAAVAMPRCWQLAPVTANGFRAATSSEDSGGGEGWWTLQELRGNISWLAEELAWRGQQVVAIGLGQGAESGVMEVQQMAKILEGCLEVQPANPETAGEIKVRVARSPHARCRLQSRLNQLMPALAAEGLVACALIAVARHRNNSRGCTATVSDCCCDGGGNSSSRGKCFVADEGPCSAVPVCRELDSVPEGAVDKEHLVSAALWLRGLLSPELDCHLGKGGLSDAASIDAVVQRMLDAGALVSSSSVGSQTSRQISLPMRPSSSRSAILFAAWLMGPVCSMHAFALSKAKQLLEGSPCGCITMGGLLQGMKADMVAAVCGPREEEGQAAELPVVANLVMAENAVTGLCRAGILVGVPVPAALLAIPALSPGTAGAVPVPPLRHAVSAWDLPSDGSVPQDACKALDSFSSSATVAVAPNIAASDPRPVESLIEHIQFFVVW